MTTKSTPTRSVRSGCSLRTAGSAAAALSLVVGAALGAALGVALPASAASAPASAPASEVIHPPVYTPTQVASWYSTFLGRDANADPGSRYWVDRVDAGEAPDAVLGDLLRTREYVSGAVATINRAYLGSGSVAAQDEQVDRVLRGDATLEGVEQDVAGSDELTLATSSDGCVEDCAPAPGPVPTWYRVVLDREPSAGELAYWDGRSGQVGNPDAFSELWYTPEAVTTRIQTHHTDLLERRAGDGEVAYWYDQEVFDDAGVVAKIATSGEFIDRFPI